MRAVAIVSMGLALAACVVMAAKGTGSTQEQDSMMSTPEEMVFLVFTETCYNKLVVHREFDMPCAKKTLAKVLGYGITVGELAMPQHGCLSGAPMVVFPAFPARWLCE